MPTYEEVLTTEAHSHPDISDRVGYGVFRGTGRGQDSFIPHELENSYQTKKSGTFCEYCGCFGWLRSEGIHYCRMPYRLKPMAYHGAPIVHSLLNWSCSNKIGAGAPFLPIEIVRIITELTLIMNREMLMSLERADEEENLVCGLGDVGTAVNELTNSYGNSRLYKYSIWLEGDADEDYVDQFPN